MTSQPLSLRGSLSKLERNVAKFYAQLQQRFEGNSLVSGTWAAMGSDLHAQAESLRKLPHYYWQSLKKEEKELARAAETILPPDAGKSQGAFQLCLLQTLELEEPIILKVYTPLIRALRHDRTDLALDFYVMVKAHITRLARLIQSYSGDPTTGQRCTALLQSFEKEIQEQVQHVPATPKSKAKKPVAAKRIKRAAASRHARVAAKASPARSLDKIAKHPKPLVKKIEISRRSARR